MEKQIGFILFVILITAMFAAMATAQGETDISLDPDQILPLDPNVKIGRLDNGLIYYIRQNLKPEQRAELRLVIDTGSVMEDDDQQGLAHFCEHMAFNGTKNFEKKELIDYLESIGMRSGPDINAYTSFDETVYMLQIPTDSLHIVETAFQILEDWAHQLSFEPEEIDKERGVITEEWRLYRGADARMRDKQLPILFKDSKYAERLIIGNMAVVDTAHYDTFTRFYHDWYRPDLQAVIAVGDFDRDYIESLIKKHFSSIRPVEKPRERHVFPLPDHNETLFAIAADKEATRSRVSIFYKMDKIPFETIGDYRRILLERLFNGMLNERLQELTKQAEPPFLFAYSSKGSFIRSKEFYILGAGVKDNEIETGLAALLTESLRARRFGFTSSELERKKAELLREIEKAYNERDKTESGNHVREYVNHYLDDEPMPGIENELLYYQKLLPEIALAEVNELAGKWISDSNRVIAINTPDKEGVAVPKEQDLLAVFEAVEKKEITAYEDAVSDKPLVEKPPTPAEVSAEKDYDDLGLIEWTLANGVKVFLKPTDFKNDEVLFTATSPGGHSLVANENYIAARTASDIIEESGIGSFNLIELEKKLAGKIVSVNPWINQLREGLSGNAAPEDLETMFQLIYLYFTAPRMDGDAFQSFQSRMEGFLENRSARPETAFNDTIQVTLTQHHFRSRPWSKELLAEMDHEESFRIYRDRFADASDFAFFFVGNFEPETIKPLVQNYLGGLPSVKREETWKDVGMDPPTGVIKKKVNKGIEPKSSVRIIFSGPFEWQRIERYNLNSLIQIMRIKLRETLREDKGGTYGVGIWPNIAHYPQSEYKININFGCAPDRVDDLVQAVFDEIEALQQEKIEALYMTKVKEIQRRKRETDLKENKFWLNILRSYHEHDQDLKLILRYDELIDNLTDEDIQKAANKYLNPGNYLKVVLYPEEEKK